MSAPQTQGLFKVVKIDGDKMILIIQAPAWSKMERMEMAFKDIPDILNQRRELSDEELKAHGWMKLKNEKIYMEGRVSGKIVGRTIIQGTQKRVGGIWLLGNIIRVLYAAYIPINDNYDN